MATTKQLWNGYKKPFYSALGIIGVLIMAIGTVLWAEVKSTQTTVELNRQSNQTARQEMSKDFEKRFAMIEKALNLQAAADTARAVRDSVRSEDMKRIERKLDLILKEIKP